VPDSHPHLLKDGECTGPLAWRSLAHPYETDLLEISFDSIPGLSGMTAGEWRSVLYALLEGASDGLDISRDDIDGTLYPKAGRKISLVLFDTVPGGAGGALRIARSFPLVLETALRRMARCECGDLNPFAVAIARFRLTVAALKASGLTSLEAAPAFTFHLAVGDSLIHGPDPDVLPGMSDRSAFMPFTYATEDGPLLLTLLEEGRYDAVVGNPPYITVKDKALNKIYRSKYPNVCKGKYALTVPFMALFFALAKGGEQAGWVGQITSNSFMKREFGTKLIEDFLAHQDLRLVADTSGAYIPGHGTPTVIIVGRNERPVGPTVRAVLGVRGEPGRPENPAKGIVWTSIVDHIADANWNDSWITVTDLDRTLLATHPWSLTGGGATDLMQAVEGGGAGSLRSPAAKQR